MFSGLDESSYFNARFQIAIAQKLHGVPAAGLKSDWCSQGNVMLGLSAGYGVFHRTIQRPAHRKLGWRVSHSKWICRIDWRLTRKPRRVRLYFRKWDTMLLLKWIMSYTSCVWARRLFRKIIPSRYFYPAYYKDLQGYLNIHTFRVCWSKQWTFNLW